MFTRIDLQDLLEELIDSENVYFQPPPDFKMSYPCIVYNRSNIRTQFADNNPYRHKKEYSITVIDADPDSVLPDLVAQLPQCTFDRHYVADQLNHDTFNILY